MSGIPPQNGQFSTFFKPVCKSLILSILPPPSRGGLLVTNPIITLAPNTIPINQWVFAKIQAIDGLFSVSSGHTRAVVWVVVTKHLVSCSDFFATIPKITVYALPNASCILFTHFSLLDPFGAIPLEFFKRNQWICASLRTIHDILFLVPAGVARSVVWVMITYFFVEKSFFL